MLSIYFRDFATTKGELKELVEVDIEDGDVADRQLTLSTALFGTTDELAEFDFATEPKKNKDEKSYVKGSTAYLYVPEDVMEDLDEVEGKTVTIILGEDNVVAAIIIEDDVEAEDFLTAYNSDKDRITVGEEKYDLAASYTVKVNGADWTKYVQITDVNAKAAEGVTYYSDNAGTKANVAVGASVTNLYVLTSQTISEALNTIIGGTPDLKNIEKKIQATLTLGDKDEVTEVELFVSANLDNTKEGIVTKIRETSKKYEIQTTVGDIEWSLEDEEDDATFEFPKVYTNGERTDIRDIEVGNVLTVITATGKSDVKIGAADVAKIYVGTETVTGEATRVKNANNAITVNDTVYLATKKTEVKMTTAEIADDNFVDFDARTILDNEDVTLYLNVMGEYVVAAITENVSDYQFGILTDAINGADWDEIDNEEYYVRTVRILLADGDVARFKVKTNVDDEDCLSTTELDNLVTNLRDQFVMFVADSDNVITMSDDKDELQAAQTYEDYVVSNITVGTPVTGKKFTTAAGQYTYTNNTVIFNNHAEIASPALNSAKTCTCPNASSPDVAQHVAATCEKYLEASKENQEVVSNWDAIITADNKFEVVGGRPAVAVVKKDTTKALYIALDSTYVASDYEFAIVENMLERIKAGKYEIDFVGASNVAVDDNNDVITALTDVEDYLIEYTTKNGEVYSATTLINMYALLEEGVDQDALITANNVIKNGTNIVLADELAAAKKVNFAQLEVSEVYVEDGYVDMTFSAGENKTVVNPEYAFNKYKANYYTENAGKLTSTSSATYSSTTKYYELVDKGNTEITGAKYYKSTDLTQVATFANADKMLVEVDLRDVDAQVGSIVLAQDNTSYTDVKAYDLRDGEVVEFTLTADENPGFSAVVYRDAAAKTTIVFIID